jgi:hypothetical protein
LIYHCSTVGIIVKVFDRK